MAYSTVAGVKVVLQIEEDETSFDDELEACIVSADALIDSLLKRAGLTVPASTPQNIVDASSNFAAWIFRQRRDPAGAEVLWEKANRFLDAYVATTKEGTFRMC